jgi:hypothetical protein
MVRPTCLVRFLTLAPRFVHYLTGEIAVEDKKEHSEQAERGMARALLVVSA